MIALVAAAVACSPLPDRCHHDARCAFGTLGVFNAIMNGVAAATGNCTAPPFVCDADVSRFADILFSPGCNLNNVTHELARTACATSVSAAAAKPMLCDTDRALTLEDDLFFAIISVVAAFLGHRATNAPLETAEKT